MIYYTAAIVTLIFIINALQFYAERFYLLDYRRIGGLLAAQLLDRFNDAGDMQEEAVKRYLRDKYIEMCATFGLPEAATGSVVNHGYVFIQERTKTAVIYE